MRKRPALLSAALMLGTGPSPVAKVPEGVK